jgi:hypothetical protein
MADFSGGGRVNEAGNGEPSRPVCVTTNGVFLTEAEAWKEFDRLVKQTEAFKLYVEVPGEYIQPRPGTEMKGARIDRLLVPKKKAVDLGWTGGIVGVEGKRTGTKIGRLVCQAIDYTRCVFQLAEPIPNVLVMPRWVFIYPAEREYGDLESVMAQNRIGTCSYGAYGLAFQCSAFHAIEIGQTGGMTARHPPMGDKRGSR